MFSDTQALPGNRVRMYASEFGRSERTGQTDGPDRSDWCGQVAQKAIFTAPLYRSRRVDQDSYVECSIWRPDEGDTTSARSARRVERSDRCPQFILIKEFPYGPRPPHHINIEGHMRLREHNRIINISLSFLPLIFPRYLTFPTLQYCSSLVSMTFEDVLAGLVSLGQPKVCLPRRGTSRAGVC
jgi:hypothetical protein